jgi:hypothetical protein
MTMTLLRVRHDVTTVGIVVQATRPTEDARHRCHATVAENGTRAPRFPKRHFYQLVAGVGSTNWWRGSDLNLRPPDHEPETPCWGLAD